MIDHDTCHEHSGAHARALDEHIHWMNTRMYMHCLCTVPNLGHLAVGPHHLRGQGLRRQLLGREGCHPEAHLHHMNTITHALDVHVLLLLRPSLPGQQ